MKIKTLNLTRTALVAAVALVLSALEMLIPDIPFMLPGIKLGLSNIAVMFALSCLSLPSALFIVLTKALFALLMRGFTSFIMSLSGGILSSLCMFLVLSIKKPMFGYLGIAVSGAFFHNFGQLLAAFLITDRTVFSYIPVLSLSALAAGTVTALVLYLVFPMIQKSGFMDAHIT